MGTVMSFFFPGSRSLQSQTALVAPTRADGGSEGEEEQIVQRLGPQWKQDPQSGRSGPWT